MRWRETAEILGEALAAILVVLAIASVILATLVVVDWMF
jgi:hypothetical protein